MNTLKSAGKTIPAVLVACALFGCRKESPPQTTKKPSTQPAAEGAAAPDARPAPLERLISKLKADDPDVRREAVEALKATRDPHAMWPLIQCAAGDEDAEIRRAAAEAVTWLAPEPDSELTKAFRDRLARKVPKVDFDNVPLEDAIDFLRTYANTGTNVDWRHMHKTTRDTTVVVHASKATVGEVLCRVLVASGERLGFTIDPRIVVSSVDDLIRRIESRRREIARAVFLRKWGMKTPGGRETFEKLNEPVPRDYSDDAALERTLESLSKAAGIKFTVDWVSLGKVGIEKTTPPFFLWYRAINIEEALWNALRGLCEGDTEIEWLVDGETIFISTREGIDARMAGKAGAGEPRAQEPPPTQQ